MAEEKKKKRRRSYLSDFERGRDGRYVYRGKLHAFQEETERGPRSRKKEMAYLWVLTVLLAAAVVTAGCIPVSAMLNCAYVLLPYAATLLAAASVLWLMCRLTAGGDPLRDYVYRATVRQVRPRGILTVVFALCTILGEVIFLAMRGAAGNGGWSAAFLLCLCLAAAAGFLWRRRLESLCWEEVPNAGQAAEKGKEKARETDGPGIRTDEEK